MNSVEVMIFYRTVDLEQNTVMSQQFQKVISENWPARCEAIPDHPHSLDSGIIEEYLSG